MPDDNTSVSELGQAIQEVSERASLLVREEIELAKAEMTEKVTKLAKGAVVGIVGGIFAVFALVYLGHSMAYGLFAALSDDANFIWVGYLIVGGLLLLLGGLAGFLAARFMKGGSPPTPEMAIEEGKLIKETLTSPRPAQPHDAAITPAGTRQPEARR
jgi:Putative Actinobacterial Holin-X, holin superfamily III